MLLGPPASGKGTQASLIQERFGIPVTSPGAMLREEKRRGTKLGLEADELTSRGRLLPDTIIVNLVSAWLAQHEGEFVFDGFPRSIGQTEALAQKLDRRNTTLDVAIVLKADVETLQRRVAGRVMCAVCGQIFSVGLHVLSVSAECPACGGELTRRKDDTPEILLARLEEYREKTEPVIAYYRENGLLREIDSTSVPEVVFESIIAILEGQ